MIRKIKATIQNKMYRKSYTAYEETLHRQSNPYLMWMQETEMIEEKEGTREAYPSISVIYMEDFTESNAEENNPEQKKSEKVNLVENIQEDFILFTSKKGILSRNAIQQIKTYLSQHVDTDVVYADEDMWMLDDDQQAVLQQNQQEQSNVAFWQEVTKEQEFTHRCWPWVKPVWSPETFFSYFYFGHIVAVRTTCLQKVAWLGSHDTEKNIYDCFLQITENTAKISHIEQVLFHLFTVEANKDVLTSKLMNTRDIMGADASFNEIKLAAMKRRGIKGYLQTDEATGFSYPIYQVDTSDKSNESEGSDHSDKISIVIPSKDNPKVLLTCINSVMQLSSFHNYEIIVVDNGSSDENRIMLENYAKEYHFQYIYEQMEFNFSKMCNLGVEKATGNYILLLNDDMEVIQVDWLERMIGEASREGIGAVGAKLLYPDSTLIQHVGITNTVDGPGHKLKQMDDTLPYYYGRNHLIYDMLGVTAACLMIKKSTYLAINGLFEGLKVAYNDVDFCFRLYESGFRNVQRNDVKLYHHESLSRGDDMQDERKMRRLKAEKETLYQRHPQLYMIDPYCGRNMNGGLPPYECRYVYGFEYADETKYQDYLETGKKLPAESRMNHAIMVVVEDCQKETLRMAGSKKKQYYLLKGWAYVPGADNSRYQMHLVLRNTITGKVWQIPILKRYRKDVENILPGEVNVALTGFVCWIYEGNIPTGEYEIWMTAKDQCSRQRLYRNTDKKLMIE